MAEPPFGSRVSMEQFVLESLDEIITLLKTIDHPQRMRILASMIDKPMTFKNLIEETSLQKSALGNHLNILSNNNLIHKIDRGLYRLTDDGEAIFQHIAQGFLEIKVREQERLERIRRLIGKYTNIGDEVMNKETKIKTDLDVRIVTLEPMRVASVQAISKSPEHEAWEKIQSWADDKKLLDNIEKHPVFGFNNPDPSPDKEEYGYEFWIKVDTEVQSDGDIKEKEFKGGLYAVTTTRLIVDPESSVIPAWKKLAEWVKKSKEYEFGNHQWLEKALNPRALPEDLILDLYCPIKEV
ncbi:MAG: GyrI-like domain-containing protein [Candidatus Hodarchaeales archaeon]|jgi:DNA gyrase inhibitor GyrI